MKSITWLEKDTKKKNHFLFSEEHFGTEPPTIVYEKRPVIDPKTGNEAKGLYTAWITLNNPAQYNSYTTGMVKGVIAGFQRASADNSIVAVVFTGAGDKAFCTGGNTKEYAEYYSMNPTEYGNYMDLFNAMVDGILNCKKPVICRVNGMRVAGGQEIGTACDISVSSDLAIFGQAGPRHGSAPDGGATDFLPLFMGLENGMWSCTACEMWSAYKVKQLGLISKVVPVIKDSGKFIRNPLVVTDKYVENGEIVYGEFKKGDEAAKAREFVKNANTDFEFLDKAVNEIIWTFTNLMPGCLIKTIDSVRMKKKFYWDQSKLPNRHWLAANMATEAFIGFNAFNTKKQTGKDVIDFIKYRQLLAEGHHFDEELISEVLPKPK
ncbi:MAG: 6-oxocyclohex-1-ene-1-carbonyl-CoA hydratase [Planctomycetes bacterium]|nr:6-oxocyclohex-1-ene-1-carbonyl-CoA hydratase [Planctomycetota bacterium]